MKTKQINKKLNIAFLIAGILVSIGIGPLSAFMILIYTIIFSLVILYRTKYVWLPTVAYINSMILYIINYLYSLGLTNGFNYGTFMVCLAIIISLTCFISYFYLNKTRVLEKN